MKFRIILLSIFLNLFVCSSAVLSADLWHIQDEETGNTLAYVYRDGSETTFYSSAWKKRIAEARDSSTETQYSYYASGNLKILVRLDFVDDRPEGYWILVHPQARTRKQFKAFKIEVESGWTPWKTVSERDTEPISIFGEVKDEADSLTREEFMDYWINSVEPDYYAVFSILLYTGKGFDFSLETRREKAGEIYDSLKSAPDINLVEIYNQVMSDINEKHPWFKTKKGVLFIPSLDSQGVTQFGLEKLTKRMIFNTSRILEEFNPEQFKYYLAQSLLYDYFQENTSLGGSSGMEDYILMSVSLNLIADLGYGEPCDYLFLDNKEALEGIKERYHQTRKSFMKKTRGGQQWRRAKDEELSEYYYLGYQFGGLLLEVYEPEDLRSYRNMDAIKRSFVNFLKYEDSKVRQLPLK